MSKKRQKMIKKWGLFWGPKMPKITPKTGFFENRHPTSGNTKNGHFCASNSRLIHTF